VGRCKEQQSNGDRGIAEAEMVLQINHGPPDYDSAHRVSAQHELTVSKAVEPFRYSGWA
jgi:hypothetical protein